MDLTPENFTRLLGWLDPNPEAAGQAYVRIRADLTRKFTSQRCKIPDKLADLTIDRVAAILTPAIIQNWQGEKERYFYRVAYYVLLESKAHKIEEIELPPDLAVHLLHTDDDLELERELACLDKCVETLSSVKREIITKYYRGSKGVKIKNRKELARKLNLEMPVLRVQALRIRKELKTCIEECLKKSAGRSH
jgi:hypothetical protein